MLLTLSARSVCNPARDAKPLVPAARLAVFAREELGLHGLTLQTSLFSGWDLAKIDRFRDDADKAGAPCLVLVEETPQGFADADRAVAEAAAERADRVVRVAHRLGCSSIAFRLANPAPDMAVEVIAQRLKAVLGNAERMELNLLLSPAPGVTSTPEQLTTLIRKVGGFRIGSYPDFQTAAAEADPTAYLRGLTPYASAVCASFTDFDAKGKHPAFDLDLCLDAIESVGFEQTLAIEFRGKGDPIAALKRVREVMEARLVEPESEEVPPLDLEDPE